MTMGFHLNLQKIVMTKRIEVEKGGKRQDFQIQRNTRYEKCT